MTNDNEPSPAADNTSSVFKYTMTSEKTVTSAEDFARAFYSAQHDSGLGEQKLDVSVILRPCPVCGEAHLSVNSDQDDGGTLWHQKSAAERQHVSAAPSMVVAAIRARDEHLAGVLETRATELDTRSARNRGGLSAQLGQRGAAELRNFAAMLGVPEETVWPACTRPSCSRFTPCPDHVDEPSAAQERARRLRRAKMNRASELVTIAAELRDSPQSTDATTRAPLMPWAARGHQGALARSDAVDKVVRAAVFPEHDGSGLSLRERAARLAAGVPPEACTQLVHELGNVLVPLQHKLDPKEDAEHPSMRRLWALAEALRKRAYAVEAEHADDLEPEAAKLGREGYEAVRRHLAEPRAPSAERCKDCGELLLIGAHGGVCVTPIGSLGLAPGTYEEAAGSERERAARVIEAVKVSRERLRGLQGVVTARVTGLCAFCKLEVVAYPGAVYCGSACTARAERCKEPAPPAPGRLSLVQDFIQHQFMEDEAEGVTRSTFRAVERAVYTRGDEIVAALEADALNFETNAPYYNEEMCARLRIKAAALREFAAKLKAAQ